MRWLALAALVTLVPLAGWGAQPAWQPATPGCCGQTSPPQPVDTAGESDRDRDTERDRDTGTPDTGTPDTVTEPPVTTGPPSATDNPEPRSAPPPPGQVPEDPGGGADGSPWTTVAYVGGGGALLALLGLLLVPLSRGRWRRPVAGGEARFLAGYPPPRVTVRELPGRPSVTVTLRLAADPDRRRPP